MIDRAAWRISIVLFVCVYAAAVIDQWSFWFWYPIFIVAVMCNPALMRLWRRLTKGFGL